MSDSSRQGFLSTCRSNQFPFVLCGLLFGCSPDGAFDSWDQHRVQDPDRDQLPAAQDPADLQDPPAAEHTAGALGRFVACDAFELSGVVDLVDMDVEGRRTPAALAWDGTDLIVARDDRNGTACELVFERRDLQGNLIGSSNRSSAQPGNCEQGGNVALGYDEVSNTFAFVHQRGELLNKFTNQPGLGVIGLNAFGAPIWTHDSQWEVCQSLTTTIDIATRSAGQWVIMGEESSCGVTGKRNVAALTLDHDGQPLHLMRTATMLAGGDAACNLPDCDTLFTFRAGPGASNQGGTHVQMGDLEAGTLGPPTQAIKLFARKSAAAYNGTDWAVVRSGVFGLWQPGVGWKHVKQLPQLGNVLEIELIWTGHDYLMVYGSFSGSSIKALPDDWGDMKVTVMLLGEDGTIKDSQALNFLPTELGFGQYGPQIALVEGRIALSWVRVEKGAATPSFASHTRHLSFIDCVDPT